LKQSFQKKFNTSLISHRKILSLLHF